MIQFRGKIDLISGEKRKCKISKRIKGAAFSGEKNDAISGRKKRLNFWREEII